MKILVHDYAGHPFQVQLSRQLALRGHEVTHAYFAEDPGPKGMLHPRRGDPCSLRFAAVSTGRPYNKASLIARHFDDIEYGKRAAQLIRELRPDAVLSGNTPTESQTAIVAASKHVGARFAYWMQDFYSIAASTFLRKRLGVFGAPISWYFQFLERRQLHQSDVVVVVTDDFRPLASAWAGRPDKVITIENWAALDDLPQLAKNNDWSSEHGLAEGFAFLYTGTIGRRNNPNLLSGLAIEFGASAAVVVVGQGVAMKQLTAAKLQHGLESLRLLPLQPAEHYPRVLATADVLVALLEEDAGAFSVPSKVLSYLCAGRPILLAAPAGNLAARIVIQAGAGIVVDPNDEQGVRAAARMLRDDSELRHRLGANGRAYAARTFDITRITDAFENALCPAASSGSDAALTNPRLSI